MQERIWSTPSAHFEVREFGNEAVLFDARDGRTHYLSPGAVAILRVLTRGDHPYPTEALLEGIEREFQVPLGDDERERLSLMLNQLSALGIVSWSAASTT